MSKFGDLVSGKVATPPNPPTPPAPPKPAAAKQPAPPAKGNQQVRTKLGKQP